MSGPLSPRLGFEGRAAGEQATTGDPAATATVLREHLLHDWESARRRAATYLRALGFDEQVAQDRARVAVEHTAIATTWSPGGTALSETLRTLPTVTGPVPAVALPGADRGLGWRLGFVLGAALDPDGTPGLTPGGRLRTTPPLARRPFVPELLHRPHPAADGVTAAPPPGQASRTQRRWIAWPRVARRRRLVLAGLVLLPTVIASGFMAEVLPGHGTSGLEAAIVGVFGVLFGWISIGFWTAVIGFVMLWRGGDRFAITRLDREEATPSAAPGARGARTALVMPICAEPVERVFAGLRAMERSLARAGVLERFDFFVLSDTRDPAVAGAEEAAWLAWARAVQGFGRIFYRRRQVPLRRKSGNVADFFRRWGAHYRCVVMLDADSIMAGETVARLVHLMERNPQVGMIQTAPVAVNRHSLLARAQQFAGRLYGPIFAAGLHYWQLGDGSYWGHNAIIRTEPFMAHCGLPRLSGSPPFGGEILSHDFVEAALMGRAGWTLWLAYDLDGSYEQVPSTLLEEMQRDRRWCQGNLQHLRLVFTQGLFGAHRALFLNGVLAYVSAALWFSFLSLSTIEAVRTAILAPEYFPSGRSLFPSWPVWRPDWAVGLMIVTAAILFLPKLLAILLIVRRGQQRSFGGGPRLVLSALLEIVLSSLLAPIRMTFHTRFVLANLLGRTVQWRSQDRSDGGTSWRDGVQRHGFDTVWATAWGLGLYTLSPDYFWWVTPIVGALMLSIPLSVVTSRVDLGREARAARLLLVPEEVAPPPVLRDLETLQAATRARNHDGFVRTISDPALNAIRRAQLGGERSLSPRVRAARDRLIERALADGPEALSAGERRVVLADPRAVDELHRRVWCEPVPARAVCWLGSWAARPGTGT